MAYHFPNSRWYVLSSCWSHPGKGRSDDTRSLDRSIVCSCWCVAPAIPSWVAARLQYQWAKHMDLADCVWK